MRPISQELLQYLSSQFQISERRPSCAVFVYHPVTGERMRVDRILQVDLDYRYDSAADEFNFNADNTGGWLTADYEWAKFGKSLIFDRGVGTADGNPWPGVIRANTKVEIWLGYGDQLVKKMTGLIDHVNIAADAKTISIRGRSMYKKMLVETIQTTNLSTKLVYKNQSLRAIVEDLHSKCGLPIEASDIYIEGTENIYMVPELEIERGTSYDGAINALITDSYSWLRTNADGKSILTPTPRRTQSEVEDFVLDEYVNLTTLEYNQDDMDIKGNLIIKYSDKVMSAFEDAYLRDVVLQGQYREEVVDAPWADSYEKRKQAALSRFRRYAQKLRTITVGAVGHPGLEIYDLCRVREQTSQATKKYTVKSIRSSFSRQGYFELMDLEFAI